MKTCKKFISILLAVVFCILSTAVFILLLLKCLISSRLGNTWISKFMLKAMLGLCCLNCVEMKELYQRNGIAHINIVDFLLHRQRRFRQALRFQDETVSFKRPLSISLLFPQPHRWCRRKGMRIRGDRHAYRQESRGNRGWFP